MSSIASRPGAGGHAASNAWVALIGFSFLALLVGAALQIGLIALMDRMYGVCVQSTGCAPGTEYNQWQTALVTVPTYLVWITPAILAARRGQHLAQEHVPAGRGLMIAGLVLIALVTVAAALMWWVPGI